MQVFEGGDGLTIDGNQQLVTELRVALKGPRPPAATDRPGISAMPSASG
jgi:hypothetical protein